MVLQQRALARCCRGLEGSKLGILAKMANFWLYPPTPCESPWVARGRAFFPHIWGKIPRIRQNWRILGKTRTKFK